jgi:hypothetical protein
VIQQDDDDVAISVHHGDRERRPSVHITARIRHGLRRVYERAAARARLQQNSYRLRVVLVRGEHQWRDASGPAVRIGPGREEKLEDLAVATLGGKHQWRVPGVEGQKASA